MSWHKLTLKVIDVLTLLGHRCLGTCQVGDRIDIFCVRICVRKTFQNLLKSEKIGKSVKNYIKQFQLLVII